VRRRPGDGNHLRHLVVEDRASAMACDRVVLVLVTLLPVIGIVQVAHSRAPIATCISDDRPSDHDGMGAGNLVGRWPRYKWPAVAIGSTVCIALLPLTWIQIQTWRSTETLFSHDLIATKDSYIAYGNLGWCGWSRQADGSTALSEGSTQDQSSVSRG